MSEPKIIEKLKNEVVKHFDKHIEDFNKKIKTVEKAKKEVLKNKGDLQTVLDMFADNNIEILNYDLGRSFEKNMEYSFIKPYSEINFVVKKPDNDVLLNIRARYACYEGKFNIDGKYVSRRFIGYELNMPSKGADAVPASFYRLTKKTRLEFGEDFGVDAIGINRKDNVAVAQIKCWNIFSNKLITFGDIVANMFMDGIEREWITHKQDESMFVFWLGKIKNISQPLNNMFCPAYGKVQYFGFDELQIIHQGYPRFFDNSNHFKMSLKNIANYKNYCDQYILNDIELI